MYTRMHENDLNQLICYKKKVMNSKPQLKEQGQAMKRWAQHAAKTRDPD